MDIIEVPYLFDNRVKRHILFEDEGITIHELSRLNKDLFIPADEIAAFRYGAPATTGYKFAIGRQYFIHLKKYDGSVFKFKFTSLYGIRNKEYYNVWNNIYQLLHKYYFNHLNSYYFELLNLRQTFEIGGVVFSAEGIELDKRNFIEWKNLAINSYVTYFMVHDKKNYRRQRSFNFANDWNATILQNLLKSIAAYLTRREEPPVSP